VDPLPSTFLFSLLELILLLVLFSYVWVDGHCSNRRLLSRSNDWVEREEATYLAFDAS
jgi:hypothetical protein